MIPLHTITPPIPEQVLLAMRAIMGIRDNYYFAWDEVSRILYYQTVPEERTHPVRNFWHRMLVEEWRTFGADNPTRNVQRERITPGMAMSHLQNLSEVGNR